MEKFGIFELLDALSALSDAKNPPEAPEKNPVLDKSYLPPDYTSDKSAPASDPPKPPRPEADALAGFYARHDAVAKKAKK